jgi:hypothetical protein
MSQGDFKLILSHNHDEPTQSSSSSFARTVYAEIGWSVIHPKVDWQVESERKCKEQQTARLPVKEQVGYSRQVRGKDCGPRNSINIPKSGLQPALAHLGLTLVLTEPCQDYNTFNSMARAIACVRLCTPSLVKMLLTWVLTVLTAMTSLAAISWFE